MRGLAFGKITGGGARLRRGYGARRCCMASWSSSPVPPRPAFLLARQARSRQLPGQRRAERRFLRRADWRLHERDPVGPRESPKISSKPFPIEGTLSSARVITAAPFKTTVRSSIWIPTTLRHLTIAAGRAPRLACLMRPCKIVSNPSGYVPTLSLPFQRAALCISSPVRSMPQSLTTTPRWQQTLKTRIRSMGEVRQN